VSQNVETKINDFGFTGATKNSAHLIVGNVWKDFVCGFRVGMQRQRSLVEIDNAALTILV